MPHAWVGAHGSDSGLLLLDAVIQPPRTDEAWDVSIDFGSTHTRVFKSTIGVGGLPQPEEVHLGRRSRHLLGVDKRLEDNFFVGPASTTASESELASLIWLPLERTPDRRDRTEWLPVDGITYWGAVHARESTAGLRGNLKWHAYKTKSVNGDLVQLVSEVDEDAWGCFFG